jgi:hypothetical protein
VVPIDQLFQPLVMRVTDGSSASNPVMGVNLKFATTLGRVSPDPVVLGSSQALVVTDQQGLASVTPSVGSVGACDVFITVTAGPATAQFQMESVTAIATKQPKHTPVARPSAPRSMHIVSSFDLPLSAPAAVLFAVPDSTPLDQPVASAGPDAHQDNVSNADSIASEAGPPGTSDAAPRSSEPPFSDAHVNAGPPVPPIEPSTKQPTPATKSDSNNPTTKLSPGAPSAKPPVLNHPSTNQPPLANAVGTLPQDKRSCRFAESNTGTLFTTALLN